MTTWTQSDLAEIEKAIATGAKRVRFQTHEVEYHSVAEMLRVRDLIKTEVSPASTAPHAVVARYHRGLA